MQAASSNGFSGALQAVGAVGDLKIMWKDLAEVAPPEIQSDVEQVSDTWQKQEDNAAAGDWKAALATGLLNSGSINRVDSYIRSNCDGEFQPTVSDDPVDSEPTPVAEEPTTEPALLSDSWEDSDGYSYEFELDQPTQSADKNTADALPGMAGLTWSYEFSGTLTNTTSQRNAPTPRVVVEPLWPADSTLCTIGEGTTEAFASNTDGMSERWCTLSPMPAEFSGDTSEVAMDTSMFLVATSSGGYGMSVPEDKADEIIAELQDPSMYAIGRDQGETFGDCLMENGYVELSIATGDTGCAKEDPFNE